MKKKKILHLITGLEVGGAENQLFIILPELNKYFENQVCCLLGRGPMGPALEKEGIKVHYLRLERPLNLILLGGIGKIIKKFKPDILVTYLIHADLFGRVMGKIFGIKKIICSKRGALLQWEWLSFFDRLTKGLVCHYLVQTKTAQKEWMGKLKIDEKCITVIPNGIDVEKFKIGLFSKGKMEFPDPNKKNFIITCVSNLRRGKGHKILLRAFEEVYRKNPNALLLIVGDGEKRKELEKIASSLTSREKIRFLGKRKDVVRILSVSDIFVLPTEKEGMSNAIIEAMAMNLPIITTDIAENRELVENGKTGILFEKNDAVALKQAIEKLLSNADLIKKMGDQAGKKVKIAFDSQAVTKKWRNFFQKVLKS